MTRMRTVKPISFTPLRGSVPPTVSKPAECAGATKKKGGRPRVTIQNSYAYRLKMARHEVSSLLLRLLRATTGNRYAKMVWTYAPRSFCQKLVFMFRAELAWPDDLTFQSPGHFSSLRVLDRILAGLRSGAICFRRLSAAEVRQREAELGLRYIEARRARADVGEVRHLRPLDTRSALLRKFTGIKTTPEVPDGADDDVIEDYD